MLTNEPGIWDPRVDAGCTWDETLTLDIDGTLVDLTGCSAALTVWMPGVAEPIMSLTGDDGITLGGAAGTMRFRRSPQETTALSTLVGGEYEKCPLRLTVTEIGGDVSLLAVGHMAIHPEVN